MKHANEIFFFVDFFVLSGFFISYIPHLKSERNSQLKNHYWLISLGFNAIAFGLFAIAPFTNFKLLSAANTCFFAAYLYLAIFSYSLNKQVKRFQIYSAPIVIFSFIVLLELIKQYGNYYSRVCFVVGLTIVCLIWIFYEISIACRKIKSIQLQFLRLSILVELLLASIRVGLALTNSMPNSLTLYEEPVFSSIIRWTWIGCTILTYMAIIGYCTENLAAENIFNREDSVRVNNLLIERDAMLASLLKANKSSSTDALSASIAHELNQPLGATLLNIQFLKQLHEANKLTPKLVSDITDQLEKDAQRSGEIIRSLRTIFSKDSGSSREVLDLKDVVETASAMYKAELISKSIQLKLELTEGINIFIHKGQFLQILLNLMNNAIQVLQSSSSPRKEIILRSFQDGKRCIIEVIDNGPGVPKILQPHLFELLSSSKDNGMGVGLWLCSHIISNFEGEISYQDVFGGGAKFTLNFPIPSSDLQ